MSNVTTGFMKRLSRRNVKRRQRRMKRRMNKKRDPSSAIGVSNINKPFGVRRVR